MFNYLSLTLVKECSDNRFFIISTGEAIKFDCSDDGLIKFYSAKWVDCNALRYWTVLLTLDHHKVIGCGYDLETAISNANELMALKTNMTGATPSTRLF